MKTVILPMLIIFALCSFNLYAKETILEGKNIDIEVSADTAIYTKYIWRGLTLDDDPVMQSGVYISGYGFTASIWGSFDIDADDSFNSDELDYVIDYTHEFAQWSLSLGHTYYDFPGVDGASKEFYLGAGLHSFLSPSLTWYHDYGEEDSGGGDGDYLVLELNHSLPLGDIPISIELSGHLGYNHELFIDGDGGDLALGVGLSLPLTKKVTLSPNINYSIPLGNLDGLYNNEFYGGFALTFDF